MTASPRLGYTQLEQGETVPEVAVNEINLYLEAASGIFNFLDRGLTTPPATPAQLDTYLVPAAASAPWDTHEGDIAVYINTDWAYITPVNGWIAWVDDEGGYIGYDGDSWEALGLTLDDDETLAADSSAVAPTQHAVKTYVDTEIAGIAAPSECIILAVSDETTALTTGTAKLTFRMPYAFTLTDVRASVNTAPTGATITVDINEGGSTILSTKLTIDASEKTSTTAATPPVISDSALADDAEITIDIDQVGSTIAGKGLKVVLIGHQ